MADYHASYDAAVKDGDLHEVKRWIKQDASLLERSDASGNLPLFIATHNGQEKVVECLLDHGADLHATDDRDGRNALCM